MNEDSHSGSPEDPRPGSGTGPRFADGRADAVPAGGAAAGLPAPPGNAGSGPPAAPDGVSGSPTAAGGASGTPAAPTAPATPVSPSDTWFSHLLSPAYDSKGWLKFLGVICIVAGGLQILTIVGILIAWLYIWLGVLLWQAGDRAGQAMHLRDPMMLEQYLHKLKTIIVIAGVATAIMVVASILGLIIAVILGGIATFMEMIPV